MTEDDNPYAAPSADSKKPRSENGPGDGPPVPGRVSARRGLDWIVRGWGYFYRDPVAWTAAMVMLFAVNRVLITVPLIGFVAARVLSPIFTGGMMTGCRNVDAGGRFRLTHLFAGFSDPSAGRLAGAGGLELAMTMCIGIVFGFLWIATGMPVDEPLDANALSDDPWSLLLPLLVALPAVIPVIMLVLFAPVLIILHRMRVTDAMVFSYKGCVRNLLPMLVWAISGISIAVLVGLLFAALASVLGPTLTGLAMLLLFGGVLGSVYMGSVYAAYVDIYRPAQ